MKRADILANTTESTRPPLRVALLGCGTVGREVAEQLLAGRLAGVTLVGILVRDTSRDRGLPPNAKALLTDRFDDILASTPDVVIEVLGGIDPATTYVHQLLARGIPVVTANKTLVAHAGESLAAAARAHNIPFAFEAAVGASLPVVAALRALRADRVRSIQAVLNGTCNFILTRMGESGISMEAAIAQAQALGLAEPDPSADLSGRDTAEKLVILARESGCPADAATIGHVIREGIESLTADDLRAARRDGRAIRLIAEYHAPDSPGQPARLRVGPALLPLLHPLARLEGPENGIEIECESAGRVHLRGLGAGPKPTAAALLGDVLATRRSHTPHSHAARPAAALSTPPTSVAAAATTPHRGPSRPRFVRIRRGDAQDGLPVDALLQRLGLAGIRATSLELGTSIARAITPALDDHCAQSLAAGLSASVPGGTLLIAPLLDDPPGYGE